MEWRIRNLGRPHEEPRDAMYSNPNSTIPTASEAAISLGIKPPKSAPASAFKRAWKTHRAAMPFLHLLDPYKPPDSSLSLMCLWWKALAANDPSSPAFDNSLTYDMLPSVTRVLVGRRMWKFYPRLHHANVEIRTVYLDRSVRRIVHDIVDRQPLLESRSSCQESQNRTKIRLITLGGGYDARSIKFLQEGLIDHAVELDLPSVVDAKKRIFGSPRLKRRRALQSHPILLFPDLYHVDLNKLSDVDAVLTDIISSQVDPQNWHTIFLFEGVMIYLNDGVPHGLLQLCRDVLRNTRSQGSLVFADRLEHIPGGNLDIAHSILAQVGWRILDWHPKPGLARHMGVAVPIEE